MNVLLHACCGPCLIEPLDALVAQHEVAVVYANPNIHPRAEYELRRDTLLTYARELGLSVTELPYDPVRWITEVETVADDPQLRCDACWSLRLSMTAALAAEQGFDAIATTLTVSPYQDPKGVREAGMRAAAAAGIVYLDHDFRELYPRATIRSREAGMYRQNYCGCLFSKAEAEAQRLARRETRKAARG
ncbi:MAG: epoxyqueuosine reductase QueH [Actinomycetota bacterium]|nr:epoxyqueuosine reductase QueH [Actinomycetota bacterium]